MVTQDRDLKLRLSPRGLGRPEQAEDSAQEEIQERLEHGAALLQTAPSASWWDVIAFSYPTGFPGLLPADGDGQGPEPEAATVQPYQ